MDVSGHVTGCHKALIPMETQKGLEGATRTGQGLHVCVVVLVASERLAGQLPSFASNRVPLATASHGPWRPSHALDPGLRSPGPGGSALHA